MAKRTLFEHLLEPEETLKSEGSPFVYGRGPHDLGFIGIPIGALMSTDVTPPTTSKQVQSDNIRRQRLRELMSAMTRSGPSKVAATRSLCKQHKNIDIRHVFAGDRAWHKLSNLGYLDDIFANSNCAFCRLLQDFLLQISPEVLEAPGAPIHCRMGVREVRYSEENDFTAYQNDKHYRLSVELGRHGPEFYTSKQSTTQFAEGFHLVTRDHYSCRLIGDQIDPHLARSWLKVCQTHHGPDCQPCQSTPSQHVLERLRLIDVHSRKVITCLVPVSYLALSYVWGSSSQQSFRSQTSNSIDPQGEIVDLHLPSFTAQTIEDAIYLTNALGFQYLWVDALCIVQDNVEHRSAQISRMSRVYGDATMTIIAASGVDAQSPIARVRPGSCSVRQISQVIDGVVVANVLPRSHSAIQASVWNTRAWTFQERVLSRRCLIMTQAQAFFQCGKRVFCEDTETESIPVMANGAMKNKSLLSSFSLRPTSSIESIFESYVSLVEAYSARSLTSPGDSLSAFDGILQAFRDQAEISFVQGLPCKMLACSLLWQPVRPLLRRTTNDTLTEQRIDDHDHSSKLHPSWTWAAWQGEIEYNESKHTLENIRLPVSFSHIRHVPIKNCDNFSGHEPIMAVCFRSECAEFVIKEPPKGRIFDDGFGVRDSILNATKRICGETFLDAGRGSPNSLRNALITDLEGRAAGEILIDTNWVFASRRCHFVFICEAKTIEKTVWRDGWGGKIDGSYSLGDRGNLENLNEGVPEEPWSYVKVMLVYPSGGAFCRIAIGTIHKDAWRAAGPKTQLIELV